MRLRCLFSAGDRPGEERPERNPGLLLRIDGFLDVGIPVNDRGEDQAAGSVSDWEPTG